MTKDCGVCEKKFTPKPQTTGRFCSRLCYGKSKRGKIPSSAGWNKGMKGYTNKGSFKKGHKPWNKGKRNVYSGEQIEKLSRYAKDGTTGMLGRSHKQESIEKISKFHKGKSLSESHCKKLSKIHKKIGSIPPMWWKTKKRKSVIKKILKKSGVTPNKAELELNRILKTNFPKEWRFVGDGKVIIDGKCPDFININGQKLIIELFGKRWHEKSEVKERKDVFGKYGYKTLVLWDYELKKERNIINKVNNLYYER